jgi:predicted nuclease of predicted toxin-antitoxin system
MPIDSPDQIVASVAQADGAILISADQDFDDIAPRIPKGAKNRFRKLSRIALRCNPVHSASRVRFNIRYIEAAYADAMASTDKRMLITIRDGGITIYQGVPSTKVQITR